MILERKVTGALSLNSPAIMLDPANEQFHLAWHELNAIDPDWSMTPSAIMPVGDALR
jgi:hypothetical protein